MFEIILMTDEHLAYLPVTIPFSHFLESLLKFCFFLIRERIFGIMSQKHLSVVVLQILFRYDHWLTLFLDSSHVPFETIKSLPFHFIVNVIELFVQKPWLPHILGIESTCSLVNGSCLGGVLGFMVERGRELVHY